MKATGIVRRIDDLGRVVIPKEIRRTMRIREGDPLEIFTEKDGEVIFKKYSPIGELGDFAVTYAESLNKTAGIPTLITDRDNIIAVSGLSKKELLESLRIQHLLATYNGANTATATKCSLSKVLGILYLTMRCGTKSFVNSQVITQKVSWAYIRTHTTVTASSRCSL